MHASRDAVWDVLTDLGRLPEWLDFASALERLDEISSGSR